MNTVLIYLVYEPSEYDTYVSIAVNNEKKASYIRLADESEQIFDVLNNEDLSDRETEWCVVADLEAKDCDFAELFRSNGYPMTNRAEIGPETICDTMTRVFGGSYCLCDSEEECEPGKRAICIVNAKAYHPEPQKINPDDLAEKPNSNTIDSTDLARIIIEKYNRIEE